VATALQQALDPAWPKQQLVGPIKVRRSRQRPTGYLANGYVWGDTIVESFPLTEAAGAISPQHLPEHVFVHVLLPLDDLRTAASPWLDQGGCGSDCDCGVNGAGADEPEATSSLPW